MRIRSVLTHSGQAVLEGALVATLVVGLVAGTAFAAHGGGHNTTSGGSISVPDGVFSGTVTATITGGTSSEWFHVICMRNGTTALLDWEPVDTTGHATSGMGPTSSWTSGGASCTGQAGHYDSRSRWHTDASTSFTVTG
jgi:hypothetical protein